MEEQIVPDRHIFHPIFKEKSELPSKIIFHLIYPWSHPFSHSPEFVSTDQPIKAFKTDADILDISLTDPKTADSFWSNSWSQYCFLFLHLYDKNDKNKKSKFKQKTKETFIKLITKSNITLIMEGAAMHALHVISAECTNNSTNTCRCQMIPIHKKKQYQPKYCSLKYQCISLGDHSWG